MFELRHDGQYDKGCADDHVSDEQRKIGLWNCADDKGDCKRECGDDLRIDDGDAADGSEHCFCAALAVIHSDCAECAKNRGERCRRKRKEYGVADHGKYLRIGKQ